MLEIARAAAGTALQKLSMVASVGIEEVANLILLRQVGADASNHPGQLFSCSSANSGFKRAGVLEQDGRIVEVKPSIFVHHEPGNPGVALKLVEHLLGWTRRLRLVRRKVLVDCGLASECGVGLKCNSAAAAAAVVVRLAL